MILSSTIRTLYWCAVFCTFFLSYIPVGNFPPSNYIAAIALYFLILQVCYSRESIFKNYQLIFYTLFISIVISLTMAIAGHSMFEIIYRLLKSFGTGLVLSMSSFYVTYTYGIKSSIRPMLIFGVITSIVAIMQSLDLDFAWSLREIMKYANDWTVEDQIASRARIPGLAYYSTTLSYQLLVAFALIIISLKFEVNFSKSINVLTSIALILISLGILISGSRSAYPVLLLLLFLLFTISNRFNLIKNYLLYFIFIVIIVFLAYWNDDIYSRLNSIDLSARTEIWYNSIQLVFNEPFGIGNSTGRFKEVILNQSFNLSETFLFPHNHYLTAGVKFGVLPVMIYIIYNIALVLRVFLTLKKYRAIIIFSIFFYQLNTMFHNAGMLLGEQNGWYMYGIIEAILAIEIRARKNDLRKKQGK